MGLPKLTLIPVFLLFLSPAKAQTDSTITDNSTLMKISQSMEAKGLKNAAAVYREAAEQVRPHN